MALSWNEIKDRYELKRGCLFYKFMREKRGLTLAEADRQLGVYKGWTRRLETEFPNFSVFKMFRLVKLYNETEADHAAYKKKFPRDVKKYGDGYI